MAIAGPSAGADDDGVAGRETAALTTARCRGYPGAAWLSVEVEVGEKKGVGAAHRGKLDADKRTNPAFVHKASMLNRAVTRN